MRNRIYFLAVVDDGDLDITQAAKQPALAATNSRIRSEVLPIFYGENVFVIDISSHEDTFKTNKPQDHIDRYAKYTPLMTCVGACNSAPSPRPFGIDIPKVHVHIQQNGLVEVVFRGLRSATPACVCSIRKTIQDEEHSVEDLPARLLLACGIDLNRTMHEVEMDEFMRSNVSQAEYLDNTRAALRVMEKGNWSPWRVSGDRPFDGQVSMPGTGCKFCREFRWGSVTFA